MIVQGRYIGRTEWGYQGINIIHNKIYLIEICPNEYGYNYVVKIYLPTLLDKILGKLPKEKAAWIPYDEYPSKYWVTNVDTNYSMIHLCGGCPTALT